MSLIIQNALLILDDGSKQLMDVEIIDNRITKIQRHIDVFNSEVIDAKRNYLFPGFIDLHVHFREPGFEYKETIESGTKAAAKGGYTTVAPMPNTRPTIDTDETLYALQKFIRDKACIRVLPYATITIRELGEELTDFNALKNAGAFAFTDDGVGIQSAEMMYAAMKLANQVNMPIVAHCEDESLAKKGVAHEGNFTLKTNLKGIPSVSESVHIARDILLAEKAGCHYHVCHVSTKESVRVIRDAKRAGLRVTAEVTPHHLILSDDDIPALDPNFKMNPPLRSKEDRKALLEGLLDGTIDFIATDHAPHSAEEKAEGFEKAPFGIVGIETAFPLLYTHFVVTGMMSLKQLVDAMTKNPANAFHLPYGKLEVGAIADLVLVNLDIEKVIDPTTFLSKSQNTPFAGWICKGWPMWTMFEGKVIWRETE